MNCTWCDRETWHWCLVDAIADDPQHREDYSDPPSDGCACHGPHYR